MKTLIVYDSVFGNTKEVATLIGNSCSNGVTLSHVSKAPKPAGFDLVVVGSPTRAFQPTKPIKQYVKQTTFDGYIAFFDTRINIETVDNKFLTRMVKWFGYSNDTLEKLARRKHLKTILPSGEFYVKDTEGPLEDGETTRITKWVNIILSNTKGDNA